MKPSPVQLRQLTFEKVCVEADARREDEGILIASTPALSGVVLNTVVEFARLDHVPPEAPHESFQVRVALVVDNEPAKDAEAQKFSPYLIQLTAVGVIEVVKAAATLAPLEDLALVNGASLVWSSMREQLATVTGRMPYGSIQLPSVHFQDLLAESKKAESVTSGEPQAKQAAAAQAKKRVARTPK